MPLIPLLIIGSLIGGSAVAWHAVDKVTDPTNLSTITNVAANKGTDLIVILSLVGAGVFLLGSAPAKAQS